MKMFLMNFSSSLTISEFQQVNFLESSRNCHRKFRRYKKKNRRKFPRILRTLRSNWQRPKESSLCWLKNTRDSIQNGKISRKMTKKKSWNKLSTRWIKVGNFREISLKFQRKIHRWENCWESSTWNRRRIGDTSTSSWNISRSSNLQLEFQVENIFKLKIRMDVASRKESRLLTDPHNLEANLIDCTRFSTWIFNLNLQLEFSTWIFNLNLQLELSTWIFLSFSCLGEAAIDMILSLHDLLMNGSDSTCLEISLKFQPESMTGWHVRSTKPLKWWSTRSEMPSIWLLFGSKRTEIGNFQLEISSWNSSWNMLNGRAVVTSLQRSDQTGPGGVIIHRNFIENSTKIPWNFAEIEESGKWKNILRCDGRNHNRMHKWIIQIDRKRSSHSRIHRCCRFLSRWEISWKFPGIFAECSESQRLLSGIISLLNWGFKKRWRWFSTWSFQVEYFFKLKNRVQFTENRMQWGYSASNWWHLWHLWHKNSKNLIIESSFRSEISTNFQEKFRWNFR